MNKLIIVGASGFGREVAWLVERINEVEPKWDLLGFLDDNAELEGTAIGGYKVLGTVNAVKGFKDAYFVCAIGSASVRKKLITKINEILPGAKYATLVDPTVQMSNRVEIGEGSMICAGNIITVDIKIGKHVIMNLDCTVGHDAVIGDFVTLYPSVNLSGITNVGESTELGTGSHIIQGINIGYNTIVGAGAVVVKDLPDKCTAVGAPAKPIKFFE